MNDEIPETSDRVPGHTLIGEGKVIGSYSASTGGEGKGGCSCGARSPVLRSGPARKRWHRQHKAAVLDRRRRTGR